MSKTPKTFAISFPDDDDNDELMIGTTISDNDADEQAKRHRLIILTDDYSLRINRITNVTGKLMNIFYNDRFLTSPTTSTDTFAISNSCTS